MILNSRANNFYFTFPRGFFPDDVIKKYTPYVYKQPLPYDTVPDFINSTIQGITFPSMSIDSVEQVKNLGKRISYQSATPIQDLFSREFSITFRLVEGFTNYWIFLETVLNFLNLKNPGVFIQNLPLRILDNEGNVITTVKFKEVTVTSFSELQLNYTQNSFQTDTFSVGFKCNYIDIDLEIG
jgi:hypothetical protein